MNPVTPTGSDLAQAERRPVQPAGEPGPDGYASGFQELCLDASSALVNLWQTARIFLVPLYAVSIGADRESVGLLYAAGMATSAAFAIPAGLLSDRVSARRTVVTAFLLASLVQLATGLGPSLPQLFGLQVMAGAASALAQTSNAVILTRRIAPWRMGRAVSYFSVGNQVGTLAGPALAGALLLTVNIRVDLALLTILAVLAMPISWIAATGLVPNPAGSVRLGSLKTPLHDTRMQIVVLVALLMPCLQGPLNAYLSVYSTQSLHLSPAQASLLFVVPAITSAVSRIPLGWLMDRGVPLTRLIYAGMLAFAAGVLVLPHAAGFVPALVVLAITQPMLGLVYPTMQVLASRVGGPESRGAVAGLQWSGLYVGNTLGATALSPIFGRLGYEVGFTVQGLLALPVVLLLALVANRRHR